LSPEQRAEKELTQKIIFSIDPLTIARARKQHEREEEEELQHDYDRLREYTIAETEGVEVDHCIKMIPNSSLQIESELIHGAIKRIPKSDLLLCDLMGGVEPTPISSINRFDHYSRIIDSFGGSSQFNDEPVAPMSIRLLPAGSESQRRVEEFTENLEQIDEDVIGAQEDELCELDGTIPEEEMNSRANLIEANRESLRMIRVRKINAMIQNELGKLVRPDNATPQVMG